MKLNPGTIPSVRSLLLPKNNHWLRRTTLVFAFTFFDYVSTVAFCRTPLEEANVYARIFMENFGILPGLSLFVVVFNLPIYLTLTLDSHLVKLPSRIAAILEIVVDFTFAWFIAGLHFNGGTSWFWQAPETIRQATGSILYLVAAFLVVKPHRPRYGTQQ